MMNKELLAAEFATRIDAAGNDIPVLGFEYGDMFIYDPTLSSCGRFSVDPWTEYAVSADTVHMLKICNDALAAHFYIGELKS